MNVNWNSVLNLIINIFNGDVRWFSQDYLKIFYIKYKEEMFIVLFLKFSVELCISREWAAPNWIEL